MFVEECIYVVGRGLSSTVSVYGNVVRLFVLIIRDLTFSGLSVFIRHI